MENLSKEELQRLSKELGIHQTSTRTKADILAYIEALEVPDRELTLAIKLVKQQSAQQHSNSPLASNHLQHSSTPKIVFPPFDEMDTESWILHCEALCSNQGEEAKRILLLQAIPTQVITDSGMDINQSFEVMSSALKKHFCKTKEEKLNIVLNDTRLDGRKPSTALRQFKKLLPENEDIVAIQFEKVLPENIKGIVISMDTLSLEQKAELADKLMISLKPNSTVNNVSNEDTTSKSYDERLNIIETEMSRISYNSRTEGLSKPKMNPYLCWYHATFKEKAKKCSPGCQWKTMPGNGTRQWEKKVSAV
jgi:hypothetical protein